MGEFEGIHEEIFGMIHRQISGDINGFLQRLVDNLG